MIRKFCDICDAPAAPIEFGKGVWVHRGDLKFDVPIGLVAVNKCHGRTLRPEDFDLCQECMEKILVDFMGKALGKRWVRKDSLDNGAPPGVDSGATKGPHESDPPLPISPPVP